MWLWLDMLNSVFLQITTSPRQECSSHFTGTSAAAPLVSGVIALTLQAK